MKNCTYRIKINNQDMEFNSEEELNSFLRINKRTMSSALLSDKVLFSNERSIQQQVFQELKGRSEIVNFEEHDHKFFINENGEPVEYMPVTKLIAEGAREKLGYNIVTPFDKHAWRQRTLKSLTEQLDENRELVYTLEQASDIVTKLEASWQTSSLIGTSWHGVAQAFFEDRIETEKDIIDVFPELSNLSNYVLTKYIKTLKAFRDKLNQKFPNAIFLTEIKLFDKDTKVAGIADLIVVDENGKLHIFDYKTAMKEEAEWNANKNESNRYQLAFYRQMLRRAGYKVETTHIVPVHIKEVDYTDNVIRDFDMGNISTKYFKETEALMDNVRTIMPYTLSSNLDEIVDNTEVHQFVKEAFNYEQKKTVRGSKSVDKDYERMMASPRNQTDAQYYEYWAFNTPYRISKTLTEAEIKARIAEILQQWDDTNSKLPLQIINFVKDAKNVISGGGNLGDVNWAGWSKDGDTNIKLRNLTYKYIMDPAWEILESDSLSDLNIVAFENSKTQEVDFITLSSDNLDNSPDFSIPKATSILGNFMNDQKANALGITNEATVADVELLKTYNFIKNNKSLFVDKRIGSLYTLNLLEGNKIPVIRTQTLGTLEKWHTAIMKEMPPALSLSNTDWVPQEIDKSKAFITYISDLLEIKEWRYKITRVGDVKDFVNEYKNLSYDAIDEKVNVLYKLSNILAKTIGGTLNTVSQSSENNDLGICIKLANEAILQLKGIPTTIEEDLKQWGNIFNENANLTSPKMFRNLAQKNLVAIVNDTMNNVRNAFLGYVNKDGGLRDIHDKLYSKMSNVVQLKALGYNLDVFDKLLEKAPQGKSMMRFKDLNDPNLNQYQKQYIKDFMTTVNNIRIEKMIKEGQTDDQIQNFLESPDARNIPLLKAGALTAFKGKNIKQFTDDFFRDVLNPNNIFNDDDVSAKRIDTQSRMFNAFDMYDLDLRKRADRIDTSPEGEFETDLELVLATYMMAHYKEQEVNKKLPLINAVKTSVMINEVYGFNPSPNLVKLQNDYVATTLFGKNILAGESEGIAKATKIAQEATSYAVMALSVGSGATEMVTGFFGNIVRLMANKYSDHNFGLAEYTKAHAIVAGTLNSGKLSYKHVGFCDAINEIYGLSDMDIQRAAHEVQTGSGGLSNFRSKYAYWFNSFPGYFNRLILFNAQAIKDGVIDVDSTGHITKQSAYQMIDGRLVYNEKLDKRFSLYTNNKTMPESKQTTEYKEQKALYLAIRQDLLAEAEGIKSDGTLARAYNNKQRTSLKEFSDEVHGSYDAADKTNFQKMAFGRIMMQFKGWMTAKKNRWWTQTHINEHRGSYVTEYDENGNPISVWKGKVTEGIAQSICAMYHEIQVNKFNLAKSWDSLNDTQKENFMLLLGDSFVLALLSLIVALLTDLDSKDDPIHKQMVKSLDNSARDFFIGSTVTAISGERNPLALAAWGTKLLQDTWGVATVQQDPSSLLKNVAVYRNMNNLLATGE